VSIPGCICVRSTKGYGATPKPCGGGFDWRIDPDCPYHLAAAADPGNHRIPWNCPTYWDGCNCPEGSSA
jgi:hypothetical protein